MATDLIVSSFKQTTREAGTLTREDRHTLSVTKPVPVERCGNLVRTAQPGWPLDGGAHWTLAVQPESWASPSRAAYSSSGPVLRPRGPSAASNLTSLQFHSLSDLPRSPEAAKTGKKITLSLLLLNKLTLIWGSHTDSLSYFGNAGCPYLICCTKFTFCWVMPAQTKDHYY